MTLWVHFLLSSLFDSLPFALWGPVTQLPNKSRTERLLAYLWLALAWLVYWLEVSLWRVRAYRRASQVLRLSLKYPSSYYNCDTSSILCNCKVSSVPCEESTYPRIVFYVCAQVSVPVRRPCVSVIVILCQSPPCFLRQGLPQNQEFAIFTQLDGQWNLSVHLLRLPWSCSGR